MKYFLTIIIVLLLTGIGIAQDPGIPDTVNFGTCQSYIVSDGDSLYGKVKIPLRIFNDESLSGIGICLKWQGPLNFDSGFFYGGRKDSIDASNFPFDNDSNAIAITAINFGGAILPDTGVFFFMIFQAFDTGIARIDTRYAVAPECPFYFVTPQGDDVRPIFFEAKQLNLVKSDTIPGDLNGDSLVNSGDVIILINFLFRNQYQGFLLPAVDVNSDCQIRLSDVIYLINYIFRDSEKPKPGCAWN